MRCVVCNGIYSYQFTHHVLHITFPASHFPHYVLHITFHASRITFHALRFTHHISRITFHTSRFTHYAIHSSVTIGLSFLDHSLHEPTYNFGISIPAEAMANKVWQAVIPEPQCTITSSFPSKAVVYLSFS